MRHKIAHVAVSPINPLMLSDQSLTLTERASQARYQNAALRLLRLSRRMLLHPSLVRSAPPLKHMAAGRSDSAPQQQNRSSAAMLPPGR